MLFPTEKFFGSKKQLSQSQQDDSDSAGACSWDQLGYSDVTSWRLEATRGLSGWPSWSPCYFEMYETARIPCCFDRTMMQWIAWYHDIPWCFSIPSDVHQVFPATVVQPRIHTWHSQLPVILPWRGCRKTNYLKTCWYMTQEPLKNSLVDGLLWGRPDGDGGRERERLVIGGLADARQGVAHQLTRTTGWLLVS